MARTREELACATNAANQQTRQETRTQYQQTFMFDAIKCQHALVSVGNSLRIQPRKEGRKEGRKEERKEGKKERRKEGKKKRKKEGRHMAWRARGGCARVARWPLGWATPPLCLTCTAQTRTQQLQEAESTTVTCPHARAHARTHAIYEHMRYACACDTRDTRTRRYSHARVVHAR